MASIAWCFEEARRRYESFAAPRRVPLEKAWVGLGLPSQYRNAVNAGLMEPLSQQRAQRLREHIAQWEGVI